jgi:hypothetical protein
VRKYGWDRFNVYLLEAGLTQRAGLFREKKYIKWIDSFKNGYNMTEGGEGCGSGADNPSAEAVVIHNNITGEIIPFNWMGDAADFLGITLQRVSATANITIDKCAQTWSEKQGAHFQIKKSQTKHCLRGICHHR